MVTPTSPEARYSQQKPGSQAGADERKGDEEEGLPGTTSGDPGGLFKAEKIVTFQRSLQGTHYQRQSNHKGRQNHPRLGKHKADPEIRFQKPADKTVPSK